MHSLRRENEEVVTHMDKAFQVTYCSRHYDELVRSLLERQLASYMSTTQEEMIGKLTRGESDPHLDASSAITSAALSLFGPEAVVQSANGCPLCAFSQILEHVSDHIALKYRGTH